ncbi:MAG: phosphodiesterase [Thermodesulfobacteriota bacterium]
MILAQISDLHVRPKGMLCNDRVDSNAMLAAQVAALSGLNVRPDCVLATGDLTDRGLVEEYEHLRDMLEPLDMPVFLVPGNHDRRENMLKVFGGTRRLPVTGGFLQYAVEDFPVRLVGLDTIEPGRSDGLFCAERESWLRARLDEGDDRPTLLFMHHPPFRTGLVPMDMIMCRGAERMAGVVRDYPRVKRVVCGHHHRPIQAMWAGILASCSPASAHQVCLEMEEKDCMLVMEPPAYQLHTWEREMGFVSHMAYVERYPGPYPFILGDDYPGGEACPPPLRPSPHGPGTVWNPDRRSGCRTV